MSDYTCPRCGRLLKDYQPPCFCQWCGTRLGDPGLRQDALRSGRRPGNVLLAIFEVVAFILAATARKNGASLFESLLVLLVVNVVGLVVWTLWDEGYDRWAEESATREYPGLVGSLTIRLSSRFSTARADSQRSNSRGDEGVPALCSGDGSTCQRRRDGCELAASCSTSVTAS
jgi:hypothetical protein